MRTVHQLSYEEQCLHQLDEYTTSSGVKVRWWSTPLGAKGQVNTWRLERHPAPNLYIVQPRDAEEPKGMGPNEYAWGLTWTQAKARLDANPRTAEVVMAEAFEHMAALVAKMRLGLTAGKVFDPKPTEGVDR